MVNTKMYMRLKACDLEDKKHVLERALSLRLTWTGAFTDLLSLTLSLRLTWTQAAETKT